MVIPLATDEINEVRRLSLEAMRRRRVLLFVLATLTAGGVVLEGVFAQVVLTLVTVLAISSIVSITADLRQNDLSDEDLRASSPPLRGRAPP